MVEDCDKKKLWDRVFCKLNKVFVTVGSVFGLNVVIRDGEGNITPFRETFQHKIIDNATIKGNDTPTTYELDLTKYPLAALLVTLGTKTGSPTVRVSIQFKDSNNNIVSDQGHSAVVYSASTVVSESSSVPTSAGVVQDTNILEAYKTAVIKVTPAGTATDTFAGCTIEVQAKTT